MYSGKLIKGAKHQLTRSPLSISQKWKFRRPKMIERHPKKPKKTLFCETVDRGVD